MSFRHCIAAVTVALLAFVAGCDNPNAASNPESGATTTTASTAGSADRCPHEIRGDKCPFCTPSLIESDGFCGEHGVAEALCVLCRPYLKAAFRAKGDWCTEHNMPESQCVECNPELATNIRAGEHGVTQPVSADHCEHDIAEAKCPFCTPSLIDSDGFCEEHAIAEALCVKCRPYLETAFKAAADWCTEHATPESQCVICNPELAPAAPGNG